MRPRDLSTGRAIPEPRRQGPPSTQYDPAEDFFAEELQSIYRARLARPVPLGDRPLIVLAAGKRPAPPGTADTLWNRLRVEKDGQKIDLSRLSRNSMFVLDPSTTHNIQIARRASDRGGPRGCREGNLPEDASREVSVDGQRAR